MATFLDAGIIEHFGTVFVILLVFVIIFGLLEVVNAFGKDKKGLHAMIAIIIAFLFLVSKLATSMIKTMVPWFIVAVIFVFFVMFMLRMWGLGDNDMKSLIASTDVYPWLVILFVLILIGSLSAIFGQSLLEKGEGKAPIYINGSDISQLNSGQADISYTDEGTATPSFGTNVINTVRHPKVLGLIFVMLVGAFTMMFLTKPVNAG